MKKILIFIFSIIIIVCLVYVHNHFKSKEADLKEIAESELIPVYPTKRDNYFLLYVDEVSNDTNNINLKGKVSVGNIKKNDEISIVGLGKKEIETKVENIKINGEEVNEAYEGDIIDLTVESNIQGDYIIKGQSVIKSGTTKPTYNVSVRINSISTENILQLESKVNTFNINEDIDCSIKVISEEDNLVNVKLELPIVICEGIEISLKNNNNVIAEGIVIEK